MVRVLHSPFQLNEKAVGTLIVCHGIVEAFHGQHSMQLVKNITLDHIVSVLQKELDTLSLQHA